MSGHFHYQRKIQWVDTDKAGIIHFSNYFRYMEETETAFVESLPGSTRHWFHDHMCPRVSASCDFKKAVTFGDVLDIYLTIARVGRTSITYEFSFQHEGFEVAAGKVALVFVNVGEDGAFRSVPVPDGLLAALQAKVQEG